MKRKIYLVRHGESADKQHTQTDFDRVLTHRGKKSIELLGKFFKRENIKLNSMISSTSMRTRETSLIISSLIEFQANKIVFESGLYNGTDQAYLSCLNNFSDTVMIIGHNPVISYVIGMIVGDYSISLLPGQCALLEIADDEGLKVGTQSVQLIGPFHE